MSDSTKNLWAAVLEAQRNIGVVTKAKTAKVKTKSGHEYEYKYASTEDMMVAARAALLDQGVLAQRVAYDIRSGGAGAEVWSVFRLVHPESGEVEVFEPMPMPISGVGAGDKALAGALTFGWSYWLRDLLAIPREDEHAPDRRKSDDGAPRWDHSRRESTRTVTKAQPKHESKKPGGWRANATDDVRKADAACRAMIRERIDLIRELEVSREAMEHGTTALLAEILDIEPSKGGYDEMAPRFTTEQWHAVNARLRKDIDALEATKHARGAAQ